MNLPDENKLGCIDTKIPKLISEAYRHQLLIIEMNDGTIGIYDGEYNMQLTSDFPPEDFVNADIDKKLTKLLQKHFDNIKYVKVADL